MSRWVADDRTLHRPIRNRESGAPQSAELLHGEESPAHHHLARVNREDASVASPPNALHTNEAPTQLDLDQRKGAEASSIATTQQTRRQGVDGMSRPDFHISRFRRNHTPAVEKLNTISKWLRPWNCSDTYERTLLLQQPETCIWLPNTSAYKTWRSTENSCLWLHGKREVLTRFAGSPN